MKIRLLRSDESEVNLNGLCEKIVKKIHEEPDDEAALCMQESMRLFNGLRHNPLVEALATINQEIIRVLGVFFRAGYLLGKVIDKNQLMIDVQREDDDSNSTNTQSNTTHNNPDSAGHSS